MLKQDKWSEGNKTRCDDCHSQLFWGDITIRPEK